MAETKASDPEVARQALEADNAPPRSLEVFYFVYEPDHNGDVEIGYAPGFRDLHGNTTISPAVVPVDHHNCKRVFKAGELIPCDENEPQLLNFLKTSRYFRRARYYEVHKD
jgi:hypothetical protein